MTVVPTIQAHTYNFPGHRLYIPGLRLVRGIGYLLKACGRGFADASIAYGVAQEHTYVMLGKVSAEKIPLDIDTGSEGRDPSW
ncbi:MAG: hypothetical protein RJA94_3193 [Pseudomonadota bacterium]|jgi:hypothetical protein